MKKGTCIIFSVLALLFMGFWIVEYVFNCNKNSLPAFVNCLLTINFIFVFISVVIGVFFIKISVDKWFSKYDGNYICNLDKFLIIATVVISIIAGGIFIFTILSNNINEIKTTEIDNNKLRMLLLIMFNSYISFSFYQQSQVYL